MDRFNVSVSGRPGARLLLGVSTALLLCACSQDNSTSSVSGVDAAEPELSDMQPADVASPTDMDDQDALPTGFRPADLPSDGPPNLAGADDLTNPVPAGAVRAGRVDQEQERLRGPEANCRVGDFRLDNSKVSVCIQAETTFSNFSFFGGNLIGGFFDAMIAGVGMYSASPEGVTMLPTYLIFAGFNGGMDLLQLIQMYHGVLPM